MIQGDTQGVTKSIGFVTNYKKFIIPSKSNTLRCIRFYKFLYNLVNNMAFEIPLSQKEKFYIASNRPRESKYLQISESLGNLKNIAGDEENTGNVARSKNIQLILRTKIPT